MAQQTITVAYFPYNPGANPYQRLFAEAVEKAGVQVRRIPPRKRFPLHYAAAQEVDMLQFDWPHDWYQGRNLLTRQLKRWMYRAGLRRLRDIPVVWTAHNLHGHNASDLQDERRMIQNLINACNGIIVFSAAVEVLLRREYRVADRTHIQVVHHGHYMDCYSNVISRKLARERLGLPQEARVALSLGRIQPYKGLEDLIDAFARVATETDFLLLAGKSINQRYTTKLRNLISHRSPSPYRVQLRDELVPDDELQVYFNACDIVALPFRSVLNSGSLLLAMSFGCPVVAPRLGSIPEYACPDGWFPYDSNVHDGLENALKLALTRNDLSQRRKAVTSFTAQQYGWTQVGIKVKNFYERILA